MNEDELKFYSDAASSYNCYAFALKATEGHAGHPGAASALPIRSLNHEEIDKSLQNDGPIPSEHQYSHIPSPIEGHYLVAAVVSGLTTTGRRGYHFYRQMDDGTWWHKQGKLNPTNEDTEGKTIVNPQMAGKDYTRGSLEGNPKDYQGTITINLIIIFLLVTITCQVKDCPLWMVLYHKKS